jgi:aldehyde:ferredoxin oxidoreductase
MLKGYFGRVLEVDLTTHRYQVLDIPKKVYQTYLGGRGLATWILINLGVPMAEPLSPENLLVFALGPASDTKIWGSSRYGVFTRSPLTGLFGESYSGGRVAEPMSRTGYDAFIIKGKSEKPITLVVSNKDVEFRDARELWGLDTYKTQDALGEAVGNRCGVLVIGPAGENLVKCALIENNYWRSAGRSGIGAVMGSKNLKGIAFYGDLQRPVAEPNILDELWDRWKVDGLNHPAAAAFRENGTLGMLPIINDYQAFPTRYWQAGKLKGWDKLTVQTLKENLEVKPHACAKCYIACGRMSRVKTGRHQGLKIEGPEYETVYSFGGLCEILSLEEIAYLNDLCDRFGMDTISAGNLVSLAIEASRMGKNVLKIDYGDVDQIAELLRQIAYRKGAGAVLSDGIRSAAKIWDIEDLAIEVKGMEPAGYDPRILPGMALSYATSPRGACHMRATAYKVDLGGLIPRKEIIGKAAAVIDLEDRATIQDSLILCRFYRDIYEWDGLITIIRGLTGIQIDQPRLTQLASNIRNLVQKYNIRNGWNRSLDTLPARFFKEPIHENEVVQQKDLYYMISDYYKLRGWDSNGVPSIEEKPVLVE